MTAYAELQVTSNFSFLRGGSHPEELVLQAGGAGPPRPCADRSQHAGRRRARPRRGERGRHPLRRRRATRPPAARRDARPLAALLPDRPRRLWPPVAADLARPAAHHQGPVHAVPGRRAGAWRGPDPGRPAARAARRRLCGLSRDPARRSIQGLSRRPAPLSRRRPGADRRARRAGRARQAPRWSRPTTCSTTRPSGGRCRTC